MKNLILSFLLNFFTVSCAFADVTTIPASMKQALKTTPDTPGIMNIVASLIVVILLIYLVSWMYMRLSSVNSKKIFKTANKAEINKPKIISGITLGQNRNLYVVELNEKYLVLGVTPNNINLIKEFNKTDINKQEIIETIIEKNEDTKASDAERIVKTLFKENIKDKEQEELENICKKYV